MDLKRKLIVQGLLRVENSGFSNLVLPSLIENENLSPQDKAFVSKVFYGTIERKITLNYILQRFISKPLKKLDKEVLAQGSPEEVYASEAFRSVFGALADENHAKEAAL